MTPKHTMHTDQFVNADNLKRKMHIYFEQLDSPAEQSIDGRAYGMCKWKVSSSGIVMTAPRMVRAGAAGDTFVYIGKMGDAIAQVVGLPSGIVYQVVLDTY